MLDFVQAEFVTFRQDYAIAVVRLKLMKFGRHYSERVLRDNVFFSSGEGWAVLFGVMNSVKIWLIVCAKSEN